MLLWAKHVFGIAAAGALLLAGARAEAAISDGVKVQIDYVGGVDATAQGYSSADPTYGGLLEGGEFRVTQLTGTGPMELFKTFCLERSEHIQPGSMYKASLDSGAILGEVAAAPYIDPPSGATQWFYAAYRGNVLDTHTGLFAYDDAAWADGLQLFFWRQEGDVDTAWNGLGTAAMRANADALWAYYLANQAFLDGYSNPQVQVLNLWSQSTSLNLAWVGNEAYRTAFLGTIKNDRRQSQLYFSGEPPDQVPPVPEPASLVLWGGFFGAALAFARHRLKPGTAGDVSTPRTAAYRG